MIEPRRFSHWLRGGAFSAEIEELVLRGYQGNSRPSSMMVWFDIPYASHRSDKVLRTPCQLSVIDRPKENPSAELKLDPRPLRASFRVAENRHTEETSDSQVRRSVSSPRNHVQPTALTTA